MYKLIFEFHITKNFNKDNDLEEIAEILRDVATSIDAGVVGNKGAIFDSDEHKIGTFKYVIDNK